MGLNWVEDVVSHLYKLKGFLVIQNEDLQMPKTDYRKVRGHSDIDVIAIKGHEWKHIECQSWWGPSRKEEKKNLKRLEERFEQAQSLLEKYSFLDKDKMKLERIFVTSGKPKKGRGNGPWQRLEKFCQKNEITLVEINDVINDLISELRKKYPKPYKIGKEEGIARLLIHLIHNCFLK